VIAAFSKAQCARTALVVEASRKSFAWGLTYMRCRERARAHTYARDAIIIALLSGKKSVA